MIFLGDGEFDGIELQSAVQALGWLYVCRTAKNTQWYAEPIFLVTNFELTAEGCYWYEKRFQIETFFSDEKSRGFFIHKSHLSNPDRLAKLLLAACLAYVWIVFLGILALRQNWVKIIHRTEHCDWSLFRLGLCLLEYLLNEDKLIPVTFNPLAENYVR